nr:immunoglobulin light chain junction region [Mus musculus]
CQHSMELPYTF